MLWGNLAHSVCLPLQISFSTLIFVWCFWSIILCKPLQDLEVYRFCYRITLFVLLCLELYLYVLDLWILVPSVHMFKLVCNQSKRDTWRLISSYKMLWYPVRMKCFTNMRFEITLPTLQNFFFFGSNLCHYLSYNLPAYVVGYSYLSLLLNRPSCHMLRLMILC